MRVVACRMLFARKVPHILIFSISVPHLVLNFSRLFFWFKPWYFGAAMAAAYGTCAVVVVAAGRAAVQNNCSSSPLGPPSTSQRPVLKSWKLDEISHSWGWGYRLTELSPVPNLINEGGVYPSVPLAVCRFHPYFLRLQLHEKKH